MIKNHNLPSFGNEINIPLLFNIKNNTLQVSKVETSTSSNLTDRTAYTDVGYTPGEVIQYQARFLGQKIGR